MKEIDFYVDAASEDDAIILEWLKHKTRKLREEELFTILMTAAEFNAVSALDWSAKNGALIDSCAHYNKRISNINLAMIVAAENNCLKALKWCIHNGATDYSRALQEAKNENNNRYTECIHYLEKKLKNDDFILKFA